MDERRIDGVVIDAGHGWYLYPQKIKLCWNPYNTRLCQLFYITKNNDDLFFFYEII